MGHVFARPLDKTGDHAPLAGVENSGWRLVYTDQQSDFLKSREKARKVTTEWYSIGVDLNSKGKITDTVKGMAAENAGIAPGMTVVAVNGREYSADVLRAAIKAAKGTSDPIELLIENGEFYKTYKVDYHDGLKYPRLERDASKPDLLADILRPHANSGFKDCEAPVQGRAFVVQVDGGSMTRIAGSLKILIAIIALAVLLWIGTPNLMRPATPHPAMLTSSRVKTSSSIGTGTKSLAAELARLSCLRSLPPLRPKFRIARSSAPPHLTLLLRMFPQPKTRSRRSPRTPADSSKLQSPPSPAQACNAQI